MTIVLCANGYPVNHIKNSELKSYLQQIKIITSKFFMQEPIKITKYFQVVGELNITSLEKTLVEARDRCLLNLKKLIGMMVFIEKI